MGSSLAATITRAASKQTYFTIRLLVDGPRKDDAYRAYAYFRWMDDVLDAPSTSGWAPSEPERRARVRFIDRQKDLLERCLRGDPPRDLNRHESMLAELTGHSDPMNAGLAGYLRNMMLVMDFDAGRRGRLVAQLELDQYTHWLATAVTDAMGYFIGSGADSPQDETRYAAVEGAHVVHMLRDTFADLEAGYFNVPREVLDAHSIGPGDVNTAAYRAWVESRVQLARNQFEIGQAYFARVQSLRHRVAGLAYIARFQWLIRTLERENFVLRPRYGERKTLATASRMGWLIVISLVSSHTTSTPTATRPELEP